MSGCSVSNPAERRKSSGEGLEIWQLGRRRNWAELDEFMKASGLEPPSIMNSDMETRLVEFRLSADASKNPADGAGVILELLVFRFSNVERLKLLKRLLSLGLDPNVADSRGLTPVNASLEGPPKLVKALMVCRPNLSTETTRDHTPGSSTYPNVSVSCDHDLQILFFFPTCLFSMNCEPRRVAHGIS